MPFCLNAMALTFERHFVFVEHDARIEVLAFDQALDGFGVVVIARVEVMIFDEQIVFGGDEETGAAGIALTSGTAAELVIDAAAFVFVGADDVKTAEGGDAIAKFDVGAASGHVGGNGHCAALAGFGHDLGFEFIVLGIEYGVRDASEMTAESF